VPGPGAYSPIIPSSKCVAFSRAGRKGLKPNGVPGPGYYRIPVRIADVPRYLVANQREEFKYV
jgi:hypothetical protein